MQRREFLWLFAGALSLPLAGPALPAGAGKDYAPLEPAVPVQTGAKIEVVELFSYGCSHCHEFEPKLTAWARNLPGDVALRRIPVAFGRPAWESLARTYFALDALDATGKLHGKVFDALHGERINLADKDVLSQWIGRQGIDAKQFMDTWNSFGVNAKMQRLNQVAMSYRVDGVPALVVDGRYRVSGTLSGSFEGMLKTTDELIALARSQRGAKK